MRFPFPRIDSPDSLDFLSETKLGIHSWHTVFLAAAPFSLSRFPFSILFQGVFSTDWTNASEFKLEYWQDRTWIGEGGGVGRFLVFAKMTFRYCLGFRWSGPLRVLFLHTGEWAQPCVSPSLSCWKDHTRNRVRGCVIWNLNPCSLGIRSNYLHSGSRNLRGSMISWLYLEYILISLIVNHHDSLRSNIPQKENICITQLCWKIRSKRAVMF